MITEEEIKVSKRSLKSIGSDPVKTAKAIDLVYLNDAEPGITRVKKGEKYEYYYKESKIKDDEELLRIKHLMIPPAWTNVWICPKPNGHLQATGLDANGRKQYKYHADWNKFRNQTKYYRLLDFGNVLPEIRNHLRKDLFLPELPQRKVLAAVVSLMERTNIRVGNNMYEKLYGSYGLTTMKDKHVKFEGNKLKFSFKGKKGVMHDISLQNKKLSDIVKKCRDIPGKELFQYYDETGGRQSIDSGMVNEYIKEISGAEFTTKDFRTWWGTIHAFLALKSVGCCDTVTETKRRIVEAIDIVSKQLGNTRAVCKKYYVHPLILSLYEDKRLQKYFDDFDEALKNDESGLGQEEQIVMKILKTS